MWQLARVTMPTAWQLEQKVPVRREKDLNEEKEILFSFLFSLVMCVGSIDHYGVFLTSEPSCKGELTRSFWALQYEETVWG
jgi:hypothetical protein